jgi:GntR family transcriptional regulator/MocR family aminotransferase
MLVSGILDGIIPPGEPIPSSRNLANSLGVARNTVMLAYQQMVEEGYLISRQRSGYFVNKDILAGRVNKANTQGSEPQKHNIKPDWESLIQVKPSQQRSILKNQRWQEYPYPFIYGQLDPAQFPINDWRESSRQALSPVAIREWANDSIDSDDPKLIEQIRTRVLPRRGVMVQSDQILITLGAQQAIYLLAQLLVGRKDTVGIEDPGYPDARNIFELITKEVVGLTVDKEGVMVDTILDRCKLLFITPSHQFPTTVTMSLDRRKELLKSAAEYGFIIIEDDYECETNFLDNPTPSLKSLDTGESVVYIGSLSKTLAPGLRIGYMVGSPELIKEARALRRLIIRHPPANNQRAVAYFLAQGHHDSLVRRLSHGYKDRWEVMGEALDRHFPNSFLVPSFGGTSYWIRGVDELNTRKLAAAAEARGILFEHGDICFLSDPPPRNFFRLGFSSIAVTQIETGVRLLSETIDELLS